jgi:protein gp37
MGKSSIEWTEKTWNPTTGCTHISPECHNCYAEKETNRYMYNPRQPKYRAGFDVVVEHHSSLLEPFTWTKPCTVFVNSMSDLFHKDVSLDFIKKVFKVMNDTPEHTYQVLTKRHDILLKYSDQLNWTDNIWMGVSVGMKIATRRISALIKCGAKHKFLSIEPLIEDLGEFSLKGIDLVFVGGESGSNDVRPMKLEWVMNVYHQCDKDNVTFFFKQWGKTRNNPDKNDPTIDKKHPYHAKGGCLLNGNLYIENPSNKSKTAETIDVFGEKHLITNEYLGLNEIWE